MKKGEWSVATVTKEQAKEGQIRAWARFILEPRKNKCENCGWPYTELLECCHIRPIKDFHPATLVREINRVENLIWLCPNCHALMDAGILANE